MAESREPDIAEEMRELLGGSPVAFQFTDLKAMAARILKRANEIAQQKLAAADRHVKEVERAAREEGFQKGYDEGYAKGEAAGHTQGEEAAREAFADSVQGVASALRDLLEALREDRIRLQTQAEADLLFLSMEVARRIVRHAIAIDEEAVRPVLRDAIGLMTIRNDLLVRVHPDDLAAVEAELPALRTAFTDLGRVDVKADPELERGGLRIQGRDAEVDLRLQEQFAALEYALLGTRPGMEEEPGSAEAGVQGMTGSADKTRIDPDTDTDADADSLADRKARMEPETLPANSSEEDSWADDSTEEDA